MKKITDALQALSQLLKQIHLTPPDYQTHLLTERLYSPIDDEIDRIKENYLGYSGGTEIAQALGSLDEASKILTEYPEEKPTLSDVIELEKIIIGYCNEQIKDIEAMKLASSIKDNYSIKETGQGIISMLSDIVEKRNRDIYLLSIGLGNFK